MRFVAYDGMKSVPFAVAIEALSKAGFGQVQGESQSLAAFDAVRASIQEVAREAYASKRQTSYVLTSADFR